MFRCIVNEGDKDEFMVAGNTREEVDGIVRAANLLKAVRTKRFFKIKPDHETMASGIPRASPEGQ